MSSVRTQEKQKSSKNTNRIRKSRNTTQKDPPFKENSWQSRVFKKDKKGRWNVDNTRLILEAQRMACNPDATEKEIQEVLSELDNQITKGETFRKDASARTERLTGERKLMREEVEKQTKKKEAVRKQYLKIHNKNDQNSRVQRCESIGDELDYDIAYQCLKLEVEQLTKDIDFLREAFGEEEDEEYIIENINEFDDQNEATDLNEEEETIKETGSSRKDNVQSDKIFVYSQIKEEEETEYEIIIEEEEEEEEEGNE